jgi:hypothetical protein
MFSPECLCFRQPKGYGRGRPLMARHKNDWLMLGHVWTWLLEKTIQPVPVYCLMHVIFVSVTSKQQNCDTSVLLSVRQTPGSRAKGCGSSLNRCSVGTESPRCIASRLHWKLNCKHRTCMWQVNWNYHIRFSVVVTNYHNSLVFSAGCKFCAVMRYTMEH